MESEARPPAIPTVDLRDIQSDDLGARRRASEAIKHGFGEFGLVYLSHHGVDFDALHRLYDAYVRFTSASTEQKLRYHRGDLWHQRGWTPPNTEQAVGGGGQPDFKECYFAAPLPLDERCAVEYPEIYAANVWPEQQPDFKTHYLALGQQLQAAGALLLKGCAHGLGLPDDAFEGAVQGAAHVLRLLRYLPLTAEQVGTNILWGEEHTDFNLLTLLPGGRFQDAQNERCDRPDQNSGLYLRTRPTAEEPNGRRVRGVPPEGCIVAQVGQQLEILTGGTFLATPHVVTTPSTPGYSRLSAAHFVHLQAHQQVSPLPQFATAEALAVYSPPVLAGTYGIKTLVDIGLAPAGALQNLGYRTFSKPPPGKALRK